MTKRQKMFKNLRRVLYIILSIVFWALMFANLDSDLWCVSCLLISLAFLLIFIASYMPKFDKNNNDKIGKYLGKAINDNPLPLSEIKQKYKYFGLENKNLKILKLFYNKDETKRCVIKQESNAVVVSFERLEYNSDIEKKWICSFGGWYVYDLSGEGKSLYADVDIALKENKNNLKDFHEEELKFKKKQFINVDIYWKNYDINSKELPFGERVTFDLDIKKHIIKDIDVKINSWYDLKCCAAELVIDADIEFNYEKNCKMVLLKNNEIVGIARFYKIKM